MPAAALIRRFAWSAALMGVALAAPAPALAQPTELFFSEYVEGSSNNKALEIYNGTGAPIDLAAGGYSVQFFFNGSTTAGRTIDLTGTVASGDVFVLANPSASAAILAQADQVDSSTTWYNGDDAVVLRRGTAFIDVIGQVGFDPGTEWGTALTSTADNTLRRKPTVEAGDSNGSDAFDPSSEWNGFPQDTFGGLGTHGGISLSCPGIATPEGFAETATVTASDPDGTITDISITSVSPDPAPGTIARTGFTPASGPGGTASADITVDDAVPVGTYSVSIRASNNDPTPETRDCVVTVTVLEVVPIGVVQGAVPDSADGATHPSPLVGQRVAVQGIVTERLRNAFFLQNTAAKDDDDPLSSDGIFVFTGAVPSVNVGDEVTVEGTVTEFFSLTELTDPVITSVSAGNALPAVFEVNPPSDAEAAEDYWERREAMRARVPATSILLDGRDVFAGGDTEVWVARSDTEIALRADPYSRRSFRDPHPLDNLPPLFDDGNGYRILLGGLWLRDNAGTMLAPTRTFQTLLNAPEGAVYFGFGKYSVQVTGQLVLADGVDPAANAPPTPPARPGEYSVSTFNVENLYDFRDDPFDGCDFTGNRGCPGVNPPFDYVPASDEAYRTRLGEIAQQVVADLHAPEVVLVQEAEDQDICTVSGTGLSCGATNNADGRPDTLQELALAIAARGGPSYQAALDRDGADDRGIVSGFLYRTDRVELVPASADDPVLGASPRVSYRSAALSYNTHVQNPKALNAVLPSDVDRSTGTDGRNVFTRPPQVGLFRIWLSAVGGAGGFSELYAVSNHFSSTPDARVGQRTEQARYNAAIAAALQAADPQERIVVGGDLNVFPRPDDPFFPGHPRYPSDQLAALYGQGLVNLYDTLVAEVPTAAYSYVFQGQAQTLDQQFVTQRLRSELRQVRMAHVNSDWPADHPGDGARGVSDHDQVVARFALVVEAQAPLLSPELRPPARLSCRLAATPRTLRADRRARVTVSLRAGGAPADEALVRLRGAGVRAQARTDLRGIARFVVRPTRAGVIRTVAPATARLRGCSARIGVSAGRPAGRLTGGR